MPRREIYESDLSQTLILNDEQVAQIVVQEHEDLPESIPRRLYASTEELGRIGELSIRNAVILEVRQRSDPEAEPARYIMTPQNFDKLFQGRKAAEVLLGADPVVVEPQKARQRNGERVEYNTLETAGNPHKGKSSPEEQQLVRDNLEAINTRLAAAGYRTIDRNDPVMAKRYGFESESPNL